MGTGTLNHSTAAICSVAIGDSALYHNGETSDYYYHSNYNTAIGYAALFTNTTGYFNTANGFQALYKNIDGIYNTAYGANALYSNTSGSSNVSIGGYALYYNQSGANNTANGYEALVNNITGNANVAIGYLSLYKNTAGHNLVAVGDSALFNQSVNDNGWYFNTAVGSKALFANTTGAGNTALGNQALYNTTTGLDNTASGVAALIANNSGSQNSAYGSHSLVANTSGNKNSAVGYGALNSNKTGNTNLAIGYFAMLSNTNLSNIIAVGDSALYSLGGGTGHCTAIGSQAGWKNTTGNNNTYIGYHAGNTATTASSNTIIGYGADDNAASLINTTALGNGATATADNQVMLGNNAVTSVKAAGSFVIYSDGRYKKDMKENVPGLAFINKLKPVTYHYDVHGMNKYMNVKAPDKNEAALTKTAITEKERKLYTGFVAQDVETVAKKLNYDFSGVYHPQNDKDLYGLSYADFVVPLVKAVQELSIQNDLRKDLNDLKNIILSIQQRLQQGNAVNDATSSPVQQHKITLTDAASLQQNVPNPFTNTTNISYSLPNNFSSAQ